MPPTAGEPIHSIKHPVVRAARLLTQEDERKAQGRYLVEGADLVRIAVQSQAPIVHVFVAEAPFPGELAALLTESGIRWYQVSRGLIHKIVGTGYETAVNAVAVVERRTVSPSALPVDAQTLLVVGERVQDPRNVGVLVRTADAAGASALILSESSADPFSRAAVRSSTGSILRLGVVTAADLQEVLQRLRARGVKLVSTSAHAEKLYWDEDLRGPTAIIFGNEAVGISPELVRIADSHVRIPLLGGAHSINVAVAAGIVLYEAVRQRRRGS